MPRYRKQKSHPRLPNGYGQIIYLGSGRSRPYAVYPPALQMDRNGIRKRPKALCYVTEWIVGFSALTAYKAGRFKPGMEVELEEAYKKEEAEAMYSSSKIIQRIIQDFTVYKDAQIRAAAGEAKKHTFRDMYERWFSWKFGERSRLSQSCKRGAIQGFRNSEKIHDRYIEDLTPRELQELIDSVPGSQSKKEQVKKVISGIYKYADMERIEVKDPTRHLTTYSDQEIEHGVALTDRELSGLWELRETEPAAAISLIMCFSGFRISAYETLEVNVEDWYFRGGVKTAAGKNRIVPIHSGIRGLVTDALERGGGKVIGNKDSFCYQLKLLEKRYPALFDQHHHPHDFRHTFATLGKRFGVDPEDLMRLLGHKNGTITEQIYTHRTIEDLREQVEKIDVLRICCDQSHETA